MRSVARLVLSRDPSRLARHCPLLLAGLALAACGGSPTAPGAETAGKPQLTLLADRVVTLTQGEPLTVRAEERDAGGRVVPSAPESYTWTSSEPEVVEVGAGGVLRAGPRPGYAQITVRAPSGLSASVHVWVQPPQGAPSAFRITFIYADGVPGAWRDALAAAAARWEQVIRSELPGADLTGIESRCLVGSGEPPIPPLAGIERGVSVYVGFSGLFPPDTFVEATGGPCVQRPLPYPTTILGKITLNRDKPVEGIGSPRLRYLAVHELGHALGLVAVIQGFQPSWYDPPTRRHTGPMMLEGYRREFGVQLDELVIAGGSHWPFVGDVMGAQMQRISVVSAGALMDLGYPSAWYGAH